MIPTKRRVYAPDGSKQKILNPVLVAIDIRDIAFSADRSEEHTSELQSLTNLVCRLLLEKKKATESAATSPLSFPVFRCRHRLPRGTVFQVIPLNLVRIPF